MLNNKKILFIGNSFTYYGKCVLEKTTAILTQKERSNDKGYFYQLCKEKGADVEVTNWTFGNHGLVSLFGGSCSANRGCDGTDHASYLTDRYFDYVVIQPGIRQDGEFINRMRKVMKLFKDANPNVKFILMLYSKLYNKNNIQIIESAKVLEAEDGVLIADCGRMITDIIDGRVDVPGAEEIYNKNSFIVQKSIVDGYHPNMLVGYLTSIWIYCIITGESAAGQPYSFATDTSVNRAFDTEKFIEKYYTYGESVTNFDRILKSGGEILALQRLTDRYIEEKAYRNVISLNEINCVSL